MFRYIILLVLTFQFSTSYVLLEVSKDDRNQSEVNAYVHKVIPAKSDHRTVAKSKVRRFEVKKRADDVARNTNPTLESDRSEKTVVVINQAFDALKSIVEKPEFRAIKNLSFIENIIEAAREFVNAPAFRSSKTMRYIDKVIDIVKEAAFGPAYRTGGVPENLKTELVHFRNGQPSMVFEVKTNFVVDFVRKMLSSHLIERYMDDMEMMPAANQHHSSVRRHPKKYLPNYDKKMRAEDEELNDEPNMRSKQIIRTVDDTFDALKKLANRPEFRSRKTAALVDSIVGAVQEFVNEPKFRRSTTMKYLDKVIEIAKEAAFGQTHRSGRTPTNLKSEIVHFKNDEPSMFFELKKGFFVNFLTKVLSSRLIENYFDEMGIPGRSDYGGHHSLRNKVKKYPSSQYKYVYQT